jgi:hypothetical protein
MLYFDRCCWFSTMPNTLEDLDSRLRLLEQQVARLNEHLQVHTNETRAQRGARLLREGQRSHSVWTEAWARALERMSIAGDPIPAERLQELIAAQGVRPEANEFSQAVIDMREE